MNREIKFRSWDGEQMRTLGISISTGGRVTANGPVMQFTGLRDRNGVDIYEGDIVTGINSFAKDRAYEIVWNQELCRWNANSKDDPYHMFYRDNENDCIIIGNIFESPELLEATS